MNKFIIFLSLTLFSLTLNAQSKDTELLSLLQAFYKTSAVTGREDEATQFVQSLFKAGTFKKDKLGNLVGGHTWPGVKLTQSPRGETNLDISAGQELWNFFKQFEWCK